MYVNGYSVMKFVEDAEEDCTRIVDSLLDVLTKGQHTITMKQIQQVYIRFFLFASSFMLIFNIFLIKCWLLVHLTSFPG